MKSAVQNIKIENFDYQLPEESIAKFPLEERDLSKLLVFQNDEILDTTYRTLDRHLPENTFLVFNNTKVVQARLYFKNQNGAKIEVFCLQDAEGVADIQIAMQQTKQVVWNCLVGNVKKWKTPTLSKVFSINEKDYTLTLTIVDRFQGSFNVQFSWEDELITFAQVLEALGNIPLPPYMKRLVEKSDEERYQTVYAEHKGSVAAPTAGLHFTKSLKEQLAQSYTLNYLTLHVGAGTFMPVKSDTMEGHEMHDEEVHISKQFLQNLLKNTGPVIAVGTTSCRSLESLYWLANEFTTTKVLPTVLHQWVPYEATHVGDWKVVVTDVLNHMNGNRLDELVFRTKLIIAPGYDFKIIDGLVTNFHQPKSTLLLLVAAMVGDKWHEIYNYALQNRYRFLSYGDGSLLMKN